MVRLSQEIKNIRFNFALYRIANYSVMCATCVLTTVLGQSKSAATELCSWRGFRRISLPAESCDITNNETEKRVVSSESTGKPKGDQTKGTTAKGDRTKGTSAKGDRTKRTSAKGDHVKGITAKGDETKRITAKGDPAEKKRQRRYILFVGLCHAIRASVLFVVNECLLHARESPILCHL